MLPDGPACAVDNVVVGQAAPILVGGEEPRVSVAARAAKIHLQHRIAAADEKLAQEVVTPGIAGDRTTVRQDDQRHGRRRGRARRREIAWDQGAVARRIIDGAHRDQRAGVAPGEGRPDFQGLARGGIHDHKMRRVDVAHRTDHKNFPVARCAMHGAESIGQELLDLAHDEPQAIVREIHHRVGGLISNAQQPPIVRENGLRDIDEGVSKNEMRIVLVGQIDEPERSSPLRWRERIRLVGVLAADRDRREVQFAAEDLEFRQLPPIPVRFETRVIGNRGSREAEAETDLAASVRDPVADGSPRMLTNREAARHDIELKYRRQGVGADVAIHDGSRLLLGAAQALVRFDEHGVGRAGVPIDDPVLDTVPGRRSCFWTSTCMFLPSASTPTSRVMPNTKPPCARHAAKAAEQPGLRRPVAPRHPKMFGLGEHRPLRAFTPPCRSTTTAVAIPLRVVISAR